MNPSAPDPTVALEALTARADVALACALPETDREPTELRRAMRYAVLGGGKRLRPLLVYAGGLAAGETGTVLDAPACAVELIHAYSLVHDDLPAMDNDALRRGRPTCHVVFGEAMAILAGDALQARAFELLAYNDVENVDAETRLRMLHVLGAACGADGMAGGQAMDLAAVGSRLDLDALQRMHMHKTGALIRAAVRMGALAGSCRDSAVLDALDAYAHAVGLAFQVRDDILDVEGNSAVIGKTAGKDAAQGKPTFPSLLGLDASRTRLSELIDSALDAIAPLGEPAALLATLARYTADRTY